MDFGMAVALIKSGFRATRRGWNGKGMFIFLIPGMPSPSAPGNGWRYTDGKQDNYPVRSFIAMKAADDTVVPWLASQTDILAEDWELVP